MRASLAFICTECEWLMMVVVVGSGSLFCRCFCCSAQPKGNNGKSANNIIIHTHASAKVSKQAIKSNVNVNVNARPTRKSTHGMCVCVCVLMLFRFEFFEFCCRFTALCLWYFVQSTRCGCLLCFFRLLVSIVQCSVFSSALSSRFIGGNKRMAKNNEQNETKPNWTERASARE